MSDLQDRIQARIDDLVTSGAERGLQVAVYADGAPVVEAVAGVADPATGRPLTSDTPIFSFSIGKAVAVTAVHVLAEKGVLDYDTRVAQVWPEFASHGKSSITLAHVLSHSAGIPGLPPDVTVEDLTDWEKMCAIVAGETPWWGAGEKVGYHAITWGFLVGEFVRRVTGAKLSEAVREHVTAPLGVEHEVMLAVPAGELERLAVLEDAPPPQDGDAAAFEMPADAPMMRIGPWEATTAAYGNRSDVRMADIPAGGTATARGVARIYAALLGPVDGVRLISRERLERITAVVAEGPDQVFGMPSAWGLGYALGDFRTNDVATRHVFGIGGVGGSIANADRRTGTSFAITKTRLAPDFAAAEAVAAEVGPPS